MALEWLNGFLGNYGWSIIVFTILFRLVLTPLDYYQRKTMRTQQANMAKINPKLEALKKKYGNDPQKMNAKQMELYKKEGISPFAGCLPMLFILIIQFPIFIAFFNVIRNLTGEQIYAFYETAKNGGEIVPYGFLWVRNLWQPDTFMATVMPLENEIGKYAAMSGVTDYGTVMASWIEQFSALRNGWGFLPLAAAGFSYLQTQLSQQETAKTQGAAAEQNGMNSKIMTWMMPIMFLFFTWTSSAAFALYWCVSSAMAVLSQLVISWIFKMQDEKNKPALPEGEEESSQNE